jgi:hypothetical protein
MPVHFFLLSLKDLSRVQRANSKRLHCASFVALCTIVQRAVKSRPPGQSPVKLRVSVMKQTHRIRLLLAAIGIATAWEANAQLYTWQFHSVAGSLASGQITSTDPNFPFDAILSPTPAIASSSSFFIPDIGLTLDLTAPLNTFLQSMGPGLAPAYAPDGGSSLLLGPFQGYEPALDLAGVSFTIDPAQNFPNAPDPQQWEYTGNNGTLSGKGYWELVPVPEPSTLALDILGAAVFMIIRRRE